MNASPPNFLRPLQHLSRIKTAYPHAHRHLCEHLRKRSDNASPWHAWCLLPLSQWKAIARSKDNAEIHDSILETETSILAAIAGWQYTQDVYKFHPSTIASLRETAIEESMPTSLFSRLPERAIYIEAQGQTFGQSSLYGYWVHLQWNDETSQPELHLLFATSGGYYTLVESIDQLPIRYMLGKLLGTTLHQLPPCSEQELHQSLSTVVCTINTIIYLCSANPDIQANCARRNPHKAQHPKRAISWPFPPAPKPRIWMVGNTFGSVVQDENDDNQHLLPGSWMCNWPNSKAVNSKFYCEWIPPQRSTSSLFGNK
jgi:hypothetical protein